MRHSASIHVVVQSSNVYVHGIMCNFCKFIFLMRINIYSNKNILLLKHRVKDSSTARCRWVLCAMRLQWVFFMFKTCEKCGALQMYTHYLVGIGCYSVGEIHVRGTESGTSDTKHRIRWSVRYNKIMIAEITSISVANKKRHSYARKFEIIMMIKLNFLLPLRFLFLSSPFNCAPLNEATLPRSVSVWVGNVYLSGCMHVCVFVCFRGVKRQVLFCSHIYYIEKWNRGSTKDA